MEKPGRHHFNQGIKVKITSNNHIDNVYLLSWFTEKGFLPTSNHNKTSEKPKLRNSLQNRTVWIRTQSPYPFHCSQKRYRGHGSGGASFPRQRMQLGLDRHPPHCLGLTISLCSVTRIHISLPEGFLQNMKVVLFVLVRDQNTLPPPPPLSSTNNWWK